MPELYILFQYKYNILFPVIAALFLFTVYHYLVLNGKFFIVKLSLTSNFDDMRLSYVVLRERKSNVNDCYLFSVNDIKQKKR